MAVHVRYNSWYISLPSSAKQQRETTTANFLNFISNLSMCPRFSFVIALTVINKVNDFRVPRDSQVKKKITFLIDDFKLLLSGDGFRNLTMF